MSFQRLLITTLVLTACESQQATPDGPAPEVIAPPSFLQQDAGVSSSVGDGEKAPWKTKETSPPVPKGMVWIPPGVVLAGTPPERLPRKAHVEMSGEQVVLDGFFIDKYAYPNERGAIPHSNVDWSQANRLCSIKGKRLCTELEWERACKGPKNSTYEYGERYEAQTCGTGDAARLLPSGHRFGCKSEFAVHDLHGSLWEWTSSDWGRSTLKKQKSVRGGNSEFGEVVGRCANAEPRSPSFRARDLGFRCCSGPKNQAEVTLVVRQGPTLYRHSNPSGKLMRALESLMPQSVLAKLQSRGVFRITRTWEWSPVGNERLVVGGGCSGAPPSRRCGVVVARKTLGRLDLLDWVSSGHFPPTTRVGRNISRLWVYGGDRRSHFRRAVDFRWGRLAHGPTQRNMKE